MAFNLTEVFDEYPNPFFIIKPILVDGVSNDFKYMYVNNAFSIFLGRNKEELMGHRFGEYFSGGESDWFELFVEAAFGRKHVLVDNVSSLISKKLYAEVFHIEPDMCGCMIHDFKTVSDDMKSYENEMLRRKANCDYLTGFYNRFYLNELQAEIEKKVNVGITFLDINNLKVTNDTLGHAAGDELILRFSNILRSHYDDSMIFRMGGDEFVIITERRTKDDFIKLSEEGKEIFEKDNLAAMGFHFYEKIENLKESIDQCDRMMYEHKRCMKSSSPMKEERNP